MKENIVIEIEGMVAAGKTSICNELTNIIKNCIFIDGGALYRGIVLAASKSMQNISQSNIDLENINPFDLMKKLQVEFKIENNRTVIYIAGEKMSDEEITNIQNDISVSEIASKANNEALYKFARNIIDEYRKQYNIVVSGRDLVSIYPDMTCHVFVTASLEERVNRRYNQYEGMYSKEELKNIIIKRDEIHKNAGYDKICNKNINIDVTDCKNVNESAKKLIEKLIDNNYITKDILN